MENPETAALVTRQAVTGGTLELRGTPAFCVWQSGELSKLQEWFE